MGSINRRMAYNEKYNSYMEQFKPEFVPATDCLICWDSIEPIEVIKDIVSARIVRE
jgi:hypothetical protein